MTRRIVCLVARLEAGSARAAVQALTDWSAAGLLAPFFVVDVAGGSPAARLVADGAVEAVPLRTWVAQHQVPVETVALQVLDGPGTELRLGEVDAALAGLERRAADVLNVLVPTTRTAAVSEEAVFPTRTNLLLQPVESLDPLGPTDEVDGADAAGLARQAALGVATAAGLWKGCPVSLDVGDRGDRNIRVFRCYVRRLDAGDVLSGVAHRLFDPAEGGLPRPIDPQENELLLPVEGPQAVADAEAAASGLAQRHSDLIRFVPPAPFQPPLPTPLSLGAALVMFTRALLAALRGAHRVLVRQVVDRASVAIADRTTDLLFGRGSNYVVAVRGVLPNGERAEDLALALGRVGQAVLADEAAAFRPQPVAAGPLWREAVGTGTALADGGLGPAQAVLPRQGADRLVVTDPERIAPDPETAPFVVPAHVLPAEVGSLTVFPNDPLGAGRAVALVQERQAEARAAAERGDARAGDVLDRLTRVGDDLRAWVEARRGFAWALAGRVGGELDKARRALVELTSPDEDDESLTEQVERAQPSAERALWVSLGSALVLVLLLVAVAVVLDPPLWAVAVSALVGGLVWFLASAYAYVRAQRVLFQLRHRRDVLVKRREWAEGARRDVAVRLMELADLYRQAMTWTTVLGASVHDPLGRRGGPVSARTAELAGDVPLPLALGRADFGRAHDTVVHRARTKLLAPGWLGYLTRRRFAAALEPRAERTGDPRVAERIWDDHGLDREGPLAELVARLREDRAGNAARTAAVRDLVGCLTELKVPADVLWPRVEVTAGHVRPGSGQEFVAPLRGLRPHLPEVVFSAEGVTAMAYAVQRALLRSRGPRTRDESASKRLDVGAGSPPVPPDGDDEAVVQVREEHVPPETADPDALDRWLVRADLSGAWGVEAFSCFGQWEGGRLIPAQRPDAEQRDTTKGLSDEDA